MERKTDQHETAHSRKPWCTTSSRGSRDACGVLPRAEMSPNCVSRHPTQGDDDSGTAVQPQGQRTLLVCAGQQNPPRGKPWATSLYTNLKWF